MTYEYTVTMTVVADTQIEQKVKREIRLLIDRGIAEGMADHVSKVKFVKAKRK
jgi:hypothetical protein